MCTHCNYKNPGRFEHPIQVTEKSKTWPITTGTGIKNSHCHTHAKDAIAEEKKHKLTQTISPKMPTLPSTYPKL